jgi:hypothetical protein
VPKNKIPTVSPVTSPQHILHAETNFSDKGAYDDVDATTGLGIEEYEGVSQQNLPQQAKGPERSVTVPRKLSALAEISVDDLSGMNPNEAQLWMLNQMQKLVEKFAGVYEATVITKEAKNNCYLRRPSRRFMKMCNPHHRFHLEPTAVQLKKSTMRKALSLPERSVVS